MPQRQMLSLAPTHNPMNPAAFHPADAVKNDGMLIHALQGCYHGWRNGTGLSGNVDMLPIAMVLLASLRIAVAEPIPVGCENQLLVDDLFLDRSHNVALRVCPAAKTDEHTLEPDTPWESASLNWFSVMDDGGKYRMWYEAYDVEGWPTGDDTSFCYAESEDGVHWGKPGLGLFRYRDIEQTNILFRMIGPPGAHSRVHGTGVFLDPHAPAPERYKAVSQGLFPEVGTPPYFVAGMCSPDGLHWTRYPEPICPVFADSQYSAFWDERIGQYVLFGRVGGRGRAIGRSASAGLSHFDPLNLVLETPEGNVPPCDVYNPAAMKYPHAENIYFMFPSIYRHDTDTLDIALAVSRDGISWTWPDSATPFIPLGAPGSFDSGSLYMGQGMIRTADELWLYYSGSPLKHNEAELPNLTKPGNQRVYSRVTVPIDRFVGIAAGPDGGDFTTRPLLYKGDSLELNTVVREGGYVRVGLIDDRDGPVPGRALEDCLPIQGDHLAVTVAWKDGSDVASREAIPTRLVFHLKDACLYTFRFAALGAETD